MPREVSFHLIERHSKVDESFISIQSHKSLPHLWNQYILDIGDILFCQTVFIEVIGLEATLRHSVEVGSPDETDQLQAQFQD